MNIFYLWHNSVDNVTEQLMGPLAVREKTAEGTTNNLKQTIGKIHGYHSLKKILILNMKKNYLHAKSIEENWTPNFHEEQLLDESWKWEVFCEDKVWPVIYLLLLCYIN